MYVSSEKGSDFLPGGKVVQKHPGRKRQEQLQEVR